MPTYRRTIILTLCTLVLLIVVPFVAQAQGGVSSPLDTGGNASRNLSLGKTISSTIASTVLPDVSAWFASALQVIGNWAIWIFGLLLWVAGRFFDITIYFSVVKFSEFATMPAIVTAWATARNFANVFFIFILLYIAIGTILRLNGIDTQRMVVKVIIIALLINFSRVLTGVVIDSGNIISYQFYKALRDGDTSQTFNQEHSISQTFVQALSIQGNLKEPDTTNLSGTSVPNAGTAGATAVGPLAVITHTLGAVIFIITASFIFFAAAILLMFRLVALLFVIILSPLAFLAYAFPTQERHFNNWLDSLIKQTFFAPAYLFNLYLVAQIVKSNGIQELANVAAGAGSGMQVINIIVNFIIIIMLLGGCILIATKMGAAGASTVAGWQKKLTGKGRGYAGSAAQWVGRKTIGATARNTVGRLGRATAGSSTLKNFERKGSPVARGLRQLGKLGQDADFGFKGASLNDFGEAQLKRSNIDDYKGDAAAQAQILSNLNPEARLSYYRKLEAKDRASLEASTINDPKLEGIFKEMREKLPNTKEQKDTDKALAIAKAEKDVADGLKSLKEGIIPRIGSDGKVLRNLSTGKLVAAEKEEQDEQLKKFIKLIKPNKDNAGALAEALKFGGTDEEKLRSTKIVQSLSKNQLKSLLKDDSLDAMKDVDGTIKGISESLSALPPDDELKQYAAAAPFAALVGLKGLKEKGAEQHLNTLRKTESELRAESERDPVLLQLKDDLRMHRGSDADLTQKIAARPNEFIKEKQKEALDALSVEDMRQVAPLLSITSPADKTRSEFILQNISQAKARKLGENFTENQKESFNKEYREKTVGKDNPALARQLNELGVEYKDRPAQATGKGVGGGVQPVIMVNTAGGSGGGEIPKSEPKKPRTPLTEEELSNLLSQNKRPEPSVQNITATNPGTQAAREAIEKTKGTSISEPKSSDMSEMVGNIQRAQRGESPDARFRPTSEVPPTQTRASDTRIETEGVGLSGIKVPKKAPLNEEEAQKQKELIERWQKEAETGQLATERISNAESEKDSEELKQRKAENKEEAERWEFIAAGKKEELPTTENPNIPTPPPINT